MTANLVSIPVLAVLFLATFVRSTLGFGEALVAVPLLALFIPIKVAAPVAVLISITVAAIALCRTGAMCTCAARAGWSPPL